MQSFQINVPQATLDELQARLANTRWPDQVADTDWELGASQPYLIELVQYWQNEFNWRKQEQMLNQLDQFRTEIDGFGLHFMHQRGKGHNPLPLLLCHGWPDSFFRFYKLIPLLTDPVAHGGRAEDAFDVVVPSLPGYGFSDKPTRKVDYRPWTATVLHKLMQKLSYERYAAHGGDVGSSLTESLAMTHADSLLGIHLTDIPYGHLFTVKPEELSEPEKKYLQLGQQWQLKEGAYALMQSTKPQTPAIGLNDSPAGLASWIVEKFQLWSDCGGNLENCFTKDELLTNITIYWATETIRSSFTPYFSQQANPTPATGKLAVPTGVAIFPKDLIPAPRAFAERFYNVQHWTQMPKGGHFAALEQPQLLAEDLRTFFRPLRQNR